MAGPFDFAPPSYSADTLKSIDEQNAARGFNTSSVAPAPTATPQLSPQDAANAAKYSTPLPPNDPASLNGGRQAAGDLYIGPTNWSNLQGKYTPYQLEQATQRDANGNISWKKGVDINSVPKAAPVTPIKPPPASTPTASDIVSGAATPTTALSTPDKNADVNLALAQGAQQYLTGIDSTLDNITKQQQALTQQEKATAEAGRGGAIDKIKSFFGSTSNQDALNSAREKFQVEQTYADLQEVRSKMAAAVNALNQGLIYEEGRPVRMAAMQGRSALLQKQGQATIGALKSVAEVLQGNIDNAKAYADDSIAALKQDNSDQISAANTLLDLYNADVVRLSADEKEQIDYRKKLLSDENERLEKNKDQIFDLATKYPQSFTKAGVTFADTPEQATQKMLPFLSEYEKMDLEKQKLALASAKTKASGGGSGSSSSSLGGAITGDASIDEILSAGFAEGKTLDQIISDFGLIGKLTAKQLNLAQDFWSTRQKAKADSQYSVSDLQNLGIDLQKNPEYLNMSKQQVADALGKNKTDSDSKDSSGGGFWSTVGGALKWTAGKVGDAYNWWNTP